MYLYIEYDTYSAVLKKGGFALVKTYLLDNAELYGLENIVGNAETLGKFKQVKTEDSVLNYIHTD